MRKKKVEGSKGREGRRKEGKARAREEKGEEQRKEKIGEGKRACRHLLFCHWHTLFLVFIWSKMIVKKASSISTGFCIHYKLPLSIGRTSLLPWTTLKLRRSLSKVAKFCPPLGIESKQPFGFRELPEQGLCPQTLLGAPSHEPPPPLLTCAPCSPQGHPLLNSWICPGYGIGLLSSDSMVVSWSLAATLLSNNLGQVIHKHVLLSPSSMT